MIRTGKVLLAFLGAALICASMALGGSSVSKSTIKACVSKKTHVVRIANKCKKGERKIVWNVRGNAGAAGIPGAAGAAGATGDTGAQGATGESGAQGAKGDTGAQGTKGDTGAQGVAGATGA